jgi:hypothetical protein
MKFNVYFEICGIKIKVKNLVARNATEAKEEIRQRINFHKIEEIPEKEKLTDDSIEFLKNLMGIR